jgi:Trk K+ transport system NAD-binding subunit
MNIWQRRGAYSVMTVAAVVLLYAAGYQWGMATFERRGVSYIQAIQVVVESITTAGFGGHAPWSSSFMNAYVLAMNLTGVLFVFLAVPVFVVPLFREVFKTHPPMAIEASDHIILCTYTPRGEALIAELTSRGCDYVIIEPDREAAEALHGAGYSVIPGDPESTNVLRAASLPTAAGVIADAADDTNASIALSVRELHPDVRVITLVRNPDLAPYHQFAGADAVLSPRQLLGANLARQVPTAMKTIVNEGVELGEQIELVELKIEPDSPYCHRPLRAARLRERFNVNVIGLWKEGGFSSPATGSEELEAGMRLLIAGEPVHIQSLREAATSTVQRFPRRSVLIAGYGRAGKAAATALNRTRNKVIVLDRQDKEPVDVVGDVRDPDVLSEAGIESAAAAIISVDDDTTAIFATLVMRELNPDLYIIVRANKEESEKKLYRAGADYVQSLATVSGRMMASTVLEDEQVFTFEAQIEIVQLPAGDLAGQTLAEAAVRSETGAVVLAVIRGDDILTDLDEQAFRLADDDAVVVAGTSESIRSFEATFIS